MKTTLSICLVLVAPQLLLASPPVAKDTFCVEKANGFYGNANSCKYYYECRTGATKIRKCSAGLHFDSIQANCDIEESAHCLQSTLSCPVDCSGHNHGDLFPNPEDCGSFYQCSWGVAYLHQCPRGLVFNPRILVCDWPENVECGSGNIFCEGNTTTTVQPPVTNSTLPPVTNSTLPPVTNSTLPPVTNSTLPPVTNSTLPPVTNSTLPPVTNSTTARPDPTTTQSPPRPTTTRTPKPTTTKRPNPPDSGSSSSSSEESGSNSRESNSDSRGN